MWSDTENKDGQTPVKNSANGEFRFLCDIGVFAEGHIELRFASGASLGISTMSEDIKFKIKNYKTAPFDSRFPNQNQTRNCWQNYLDFHRRERAMTAKGGDVSVCEWYRRVYKSFCPYPGSQAGMTAVQKARFLERYDMAPHLSSSVSSVFPG